MSITDKENELFKRWQKERPQRKPFVKDGVVNGGEYEKSKVKTVFVVREYAHAKEGYDLREEELTRYEHKIWQRVADTLYRIHQMSGYEQKASAEERMPPGICAFNLGKAGGNRTTDMTQLEIVAMDDREFILQQVEIYNPNLIICGGTFDIFHRVDGRKNEESKRTSKKFQWYKRNNKQYVIGAYHPSSFGKVQWDTEQLLEAIREMDNNALGLKKA